ncbi:hypothetical protein BO70DRAFT_413517 [Aspergillus heteromorphus CBS 117.55]|uniref:Uncharacterized protein n=1 Tax=Aspergillus heteromorphus CBS 117.55 TaxID=1448321 RepID=A0A317VLZ6_9EURO|nr:uncharacterized protein BO70DRAFT_413517 [Aspergillus heteromorphus CBS 117.55]PWY72930.1 hypothetical protein BO70DRAFT_413517 [Aspergillus heteromorphus CBS 117.55]
MDYLRKSRSSRSMRRSHHSSQSTEPLDPIIAKQHATAAASRAMLGSRCSYDALGGPGNMAVPPRRHRPSGSLQTSSTGASVDYRSSRRSTTAENTDTQNVDRTPSTALPSISEFRGLDAGDPALNSSYRRLRKTRSMFSTGPRPSRLSYGSPASESCRNHLAEAVHSRDSSRGYGTLRRSMSFFRGDSQALRHAKSHDAAIELARDQYQQSASANRPRKSSLSVPKSRREHRPFRKTLRTTTLVSDAATTPLVQQSVNTSSYGKTRSLSSSIKKGLKRVLGFSRASANVQAEVSPSCVRQSQDMSSEAQPDSLNHVFRRSGSSESFATSHSRVTSWADSTIANTIVTHKAGDCSSLSIIDERGHSSQNLPKPEPCDRSGNCVPAWSPPRPNGMVDSQRLYSALMRRIDGSKTQGEGEEVVLGHVKEHRAVPTPASSVYARRSRQTVRLISSNETMQSPGSFMTANAGMTPQLQGQGPGPQMHRPQHVRDSDDRNPYSTCGDLSSFGVRGADKDKSAMGRPHTPNEFDSPSVYSRTTSGNSPNMDQKAAASSDGEEEPGMATIFESERTAYSSPKRNAPDAKRPSADWQQWMHTQMARIENIAPRRHYREEAQIEDEGADFTYRTPAQNPAPRQSLEDDMWTSCKVTATSNFSRPFSRSSSLRTTVTAKEQPVPPPPAPVPTPPKVSGSSSGQSLFINQCETGSNSLALSPMQVALNNRPRAPESPTPRRDATDKPQWQSASKRYGQYRPKWSPGTQDVKPFQGRSSRSHRDHRRLTNENMRAENVYGGVPSPDTQLQNTYSPMSSKRMVEMFLESRRRRMGTDMSDEAPSEVAFV